MRGRGDDYWNSQEGWTRFDKVLVGLDERWSLAATTIVFIQPAAPGGLKIS